MRNRILLGLLLVVATAAALLLGSRQFSGHRLQLKAYFRDAQGLKANAPVRIAGVDVGYVKSVRVRPELGEKAAEVIMSLRTPYELQVPGDSVVSLSEAGVLGETFPDIEIDGASGPAAVNGAVLRSRESENLTTRQWVEKISSILQRKPCDSQASTQAGGSSTAPDTTRKRNQ